MRYPEFLQPGQTIGYVAPSYGTAIEPYRTAFLNALEKFRKKGYGTVLGPNCFASDGIGKSSTPESCGAEIISDSNTAAAFCYYCHNPVILKGRVDGMYKPSMVLPFDFDRDKAVDFYKNLIIAMEK